MLKYNAMLRGVAITALTVAASNLHADIVTLVDKNATATINTLSQSGQYSWTVDGVEHLAKQWFWYRVGNNAEQSIDTLNQFSILQTKTPLNNTTINSLRVEYREPVPTPRFSIRIQLSLLGNTPGSGRANLSEIITIRNLTNQPLNDFNFYQYVDLDLGGNISDTLVQVVGDNLNTALQTDDDTEVSETVVTPVPTRRQVGFAPALLSLLNDGFATNLNNAVAPLGPGDLAWAFQWTFNLPAFGSFIISKDKEILMTQPIPEPAGLALLGVGAAVLLVRRGARRP